MLKTKPLNYYDCGFERERIHSLIKSTTLDLISSSGILPHIHNFIRCGFAMFYPIIAFLIF